MHLTTKKSVMLLAVLVAMSACNNNKKAAHPIAPSIATPAQEVQSTNSSEVKAPEAKALPKSAYEETEDSLAKMSEALADVYLSSPVEKKREELSGLLSEAMSNSEYFVAIDNKIKEGASKINGIVVSAFADIDYKGIVTSVRSAAATSIETADEAYQVVAAGRVGEVANKYILEKITTGLLDMHEYSVEKTSVGIEKTVDTASSLWERSKRSVLEVHSYLVDKLSNAMSESETFQVVDEAVRNAGELYTNQLSEAMSNSDGFKKVDAFVQSELEDVKLTYEKRINELSQGLSDSEFFVAVDSILTGKPTTNSTREAIESSYKKAYALAEKSVAIANAKSKDYQIQASDLFFNLVVDKMWKTEANFLITNMENLYSAMVNKTSEAMSDSKTFKVFETEIKKLGTVYGNSISQTISENEKLRKTDEYVRGVLDQIVKFEEITRPKN